MKMLGIGLVSSLWMVIGCGGGTPGMDMAMGAKDLAMGAADLTMSGADLAGADQAGMGGNVVHVGPNGNFAYEPAMLTVKVGDTVTWIWDSSGHSVVSGMVGMTGGVPDNKFCSPGDMTCDMLHTSNAGDMYMHKFTQAGTFDYYCNPHVFTGQIIVQ